MKREISKLCVLGMTALMVSSILLPASAKADSVEGEDDIKPYISLGADLKASERKTVLDILGVEGDDLKDYTVVTITNADEHKYLDDYLSASVIGSRALSSVLVEKEDKGEGIDVTTKNITYCTPGMYENALTTAGITDADVKVAGPFRISGTAALVGAMKAYEEMTGETISKDSADAATNELVVTSKLGDELEDKDKAEKFVAMVKEKVLSDGTSSDEDINQIIDNTSKDLDVDLTDSQKEQIADLMKKIDRLDLSADQLKEQANKIYDEINKMDLGGKGGFGGIVKSIFQTIYDAIYSLFD